MEIEIDGKKKQKQKVSAYWTHADPISLFSDSLKSLFPLLRCTYHWYLYVGVHMSVDSLSCLLFQSINIPTHLFTKHICMSD